MVLQTRIFFLVNHFSPTWKKVNLWYKTTFFSGQSLFSSQISWTRFLEPDFLNQISWTRFLEPLFYTFLEKWLQIKWSKVARVQAKKRSIKNSQICYFWATQTLYTSNESWEQCSLRFEIKLEDFVVKKLKKKDFVILDPPKIMISSRSRLNFWKTYQNSKKMTWLPCS